MEPETPRANQLYLDTEIQKALVIIPRAMRTTRPGLSHSVLMALEINQSIQAELNAPLETTIE